MSSCVIIMHAIFMTPYSFRDYMEYILYCYFNATAPCTAIKLKGIINGEKLLTS